MDFASIIIGVIVIASFVVPVWLLNRKKKKQQKLLVKQFQADAASLGIYPEELEIWRSKAMGIDNKNNKLIYAEYLGNKVKLKQVDIAQVQSCKYIATTTKDTKNKIDVLDKVYLRLVMNASASGVETIDIYNSEYEQFADEEIKRAKKWTTKITAMR